MVDVYVALLDAKEADVGIVWYVGCRDAGHEESKKSKCQQKSDVECGTSIEKILDF